MKAKEVQIEKIFPLSKEQKEILFYYLQDKKMYSWRYKIGFTGAIHKECFEKAWNIIVQKYPELRSIFKYRNVMEPCQIVLNRRPITINYCVDEKKWMKIKREKVVFDIEKDELFRVSIKENSDNTGEILLNFHHIIIDGWGMNVVIESFLDIYSTLVMGGEIRTTFFNKSYDLYVAWQQKNFVKEKLTFWERYLNNACILEIDSAVEEDNPRNEIITGSCKVPKISEEFQNKRNIPLSSWIIGTWIIAINMATYVPEKELLFGLIYSGRYSNYPYAVDTIGTMANILPLKYKLDITAPILVIIKQIHQEIKNIGKHVDCAFSDIAKVTNIKKIDWFINYQGSLENSFLHKKIIENTPYEFVLEDLEDRGEISRNFNIDIWEEGEEIKWEITYIPEWINSKIVEKISKAFLDLFNRCMFAENMTIENFIQSKGITGKKKSNHDNNILVWIERIAKKYFYKSAIECMDKIYTYEEMWDNVLKTSDFLLQNGIKPLDKIGIYMKRTPEMIFAILAIWRIKCTYIPIESGEVSNSTKIIFETCKVKHIIINEPEYQNIFGLQTIVLTQEKIANITVYRRSYDQLNEEAYIIGTSGTSGIPKGVSISHSNLYNYIAWAQEEYQVEESSVFPFFTSISFDLTITSIFLPLVSGGKIVVYPMKNKFEVIRKILYDRKANYIKCTPSHLLLFNRINKEIKNSSIKAFILGGENLELSLVKKTQELWGDHIEIYNEYGPTECTVGCICHKYNNCVQYGKSIPIGKPIYNMTVYLFYCGIISADEGEIGEIFISGEGVSKGYINVQQLHNNPFVYHLLKENIYRTGDMARLKGGELEYVGRKDRQIKLNGYRIELDYIEEKIKEYNNIAEAAVKQDKHLNIIEAYVVFITGDMEEIPKLKEYLEKILPDYMMPQYFCVLSNLPLNKNGKIDYKKLSHDKNKNETLYANDVESQKILKEAWKKILGISLNVKNENFFTLGGDSIKALQLVAEVRTGGYELTLKDIYNFPDFSGMLRKIRKKTYIAKNEKVYGNFILSPAQIEFFEKKLENPSYYNQSVLLKCNERIDEKKLKIAFDSILYTHDILRTVFRKKNDINPYILKKCHIIIGKKDLRNVKNPKKILDNCRKQSQKKFNLSVAPLINVTIFNLKKADLINIVIHHLLIDGVSWRILLDDLERNYLNIVRNGYVIHPERTTSFQCWTQGLTNYSKTLKGSIIESYWKKLISLEYESIPKDKVGQIKKGRIEKIEIQLSQYETECLIKEVVPSYNMEINGIFLFVLSQSIQKWKNVKKIMVDLEGHGREEVVKGADISRTIGWFTSKYPFFLDADFDYSIEIISEKLKAIPNRGIDYAILKYYTCPKSYTNIRSEICFNYLGQYNQNIGNFFEMEQIFPLNDEDILGNSQYLLEFNLIIIKGRLTIRIVYNQRNFQERSILRLIDIYSNILRDIILDKPSKKNMIIGQKELELCLNKKNEVLSNKRNLKIQDICNVSELQKGILYHYLFDPKTEYYCEKIIYRIQGKIDFKILERTIKILCEKYEILRTYFDIYDLKVFKQIIVENPQISIEHITIKDTSDTKTKVYMMLKENKHFNITDELPWSINLINTSDDASIIIFDFFHVILDALSIRILEKEFAKIYETLMQGKIYIDKEGTLLQYKKYVEWVSEENRKKALEMWKGYLKEVVVEKEESKNIGTRSLKKQEIVLPATCVEQLNEICVKWEVSLNMLLFALMGKFLQTHHKKKKILVGCVVSGRNFALDGIEEAIGLFVNTIPVVIDDMLNIKALVKNVQNDILNMEQWGFLSLAEILGTVKKSIQEIFAVINIQSSMTQKKQVGGFTVDNIEYLERANYNFYFQIDTSDNCVKIEAFYCDEIFKENIEMEYLEKLEAYFNQIICHCINKKSYNQEYIDFDL